MPLCEYVVLFHTYGNCVEQTVTELVLDVLTFMVKRSVSTDAHPAVLVYE
jgi:hypothetical protein